MLRIEEVWGARVTWHWVCLAGSASGLEKRDTYNTLAAAGMGGM